MHSQVVFTLSLVLILNSVSSFAENSTEKVAIAVKNETDQKSEPKVDNHLNQSIYAEGISSNTPKSRIKGRKGAIIENETDLSEHDIESSSSPINITSTTLKIGLTNVTDVSNVTAVSNTHTSTTMKPQPSTTKLPTTPKVISKPEITFSADDSPAILDNEKNINYNANFSKFEEIATPKTSSDTDHTIIDEENRTRRSYMLYMGLAVSLPVAFTLMHVMYKKIRNWMEIRHYQRVVSLI